MLIWGAIVVPIALAVVQLVYFRRRVLWWETLIPLGVSLILIFLLKLGVETAQVTDTEYWGGYAKSAEYTEAWNERVSCRHPKYRRDSKGNRVFAGYEHSYDVDEHPPHWDLTDSNGISISISSENFESLAARWRNRRFVELHRHYHTRDGNKYVATWPGDDDSLEPVVTEHRWENRVQTASSLFNFTEVDKKTRAEFGLFEHSELRGYSQVAIQGDGGQTQARAERMLQLLNAKIGAAKRVKMYILVYKGQPLEASFKQEALWKGGKQNEFIITIGVDDQLQVKWSRVISWTDVESLKVGARDWIGRTFTDKKAPLDLTKVVDWLGESIPREFVKKDFREFSYLAVEPPTWGIVLTYVITLLVNIGISYWIIANEFNEPGEPRFRSVRDLLR